MYSKKKFIIIGAIVVLTIAGILVMNKIYQNKLEEKDIQISELELELERIGDTTYVYRLAADVKAGNECMDYELEEIQVLANSVSETTVYYPEDIQGRYYLLDMKAGTILTSDMFVDYELEDDMRYMDVVFDEIPIGLSEGDYIDVRISFPLGQDYIAMTHKKVAEINDSTVKLIVNQEDFYCYESMKTDLATYKATKVYGAQYVSAGTQAAATTYYPVNLEVLLTMIKDPNIETGDYSNTLVLRQQLEEQLNNSDKVDVAQTVTSGKQSISQKFAQATQAYEKLQAEKEKDAAAAQKAAERANANK